MLDEAGRWSPCGSTTARCRDGKVETYTRCVEAICGSADTFFTSVFSAQGKRQLSTYRNGEIKTLLADLLGQEEIRALGQKAAETARLLKAGLAPCGRSRPALDEEGAAHRRRAERPTATERACPVPSAERKQAAQAALDAAHSAAGPLGGRAGAVAGHRGAPHPVDGETPVACSTSPQTVTSAQDAGPGRAAAAGSAGAARRAPASQAQRGGALSRSRRAMPRRPGEADAVRRAAVRLPLAESVLRLRAARTLACSRQQVQWLTQCQGAVRLAEQKLPASSAKPARRRSGRTNWRVASASPTKCPAPAPTCRGDASCWAMRARPVLDPERQGPDGPPGAREGIWSQRDLAAAIAAVRRWPARHRPWLTGRTSRSRCARARAPAGACWPPRRRACARRERRWPRSTRNSRRSARHAVATAARRPRSRPSASRSPPRGSDRQADRAAVAAIARRWTD